MYLVASAKVKAAQRSTETRLTPALTEKLGLVKESSQRWYVMTRARTAPLLPKCDDHIFASPV